MARYLKSISTILLVCFVCLSANAQFTSKKKKDLWQSLAEVTANLEVNKKPLLIDVYTSWCRYCKVMDASIYRNDSVYLYLKNKFYRYKFDAETKDTITWENKHYLYNSRYEVNNFAVYLTRGNLVYPTTVIITPGGQPYYQPGLLKEGEMELLLKYFGEENAGKVSLEEYSKSFTPSWK